MTADDDTDMVAAEHVLGVASSEEREAVRRRLETDPDLARAVAEWERRLFPLAAASGEVAPPPGLLGAIDARIVASPAGRPEARTLRASERSWQTIGPGVSISILSRSKSTHRQTMLLRCEPGAVLPAHGHDGDEEILVLEGDFVMGELELAAGDYHVAPKGSAHPAAFTRSGCVLLVTAGH